MSKIAPAETACNVQREAFRKTALDAAENLSALLTALDSADDKAAYDSARAVEAGMFALRLHAYQVLHGKRPNAAWFTAQRIKERMGKRLKELESDGLTEARQKKIEQALGKIQISVVRITAGCEEDGSDLHFLRTAFFSTLQAVARLEDRKRGEWRDLPGATLAEEERWTLSADQVIRLYCESCDPRAGSRLVKNRQLIVQGLKACSNLGTATGWLARNKRESILPELCRPLGFERAEWAVIREDIRRAKGKGQPKKASTRTPVHGVKGRFVG